MVKAIIQYEFGGPDVLRYETVADPAPGERQVHIAVHAAGVHLVDTVIRDGAADVPGGRPTLPMTPGREVAGLVDAVGPGVDDGWVGRRVVAHLGFASGGYASQAVADAAACIALAEHVDAPSAVAMVGTGRTTMAVLELAELRSGDVVLVTAAAGGIGSLVIQAARRVGATVVAAAGGAEKVATALALGADIAVDYGHPDWVAELARRLDGHRVTVALDGVGGAIGRAVFDAVAPGGRMVLYGNSSGEHLPICTADLFSSGVSISAAVGARLFARKGGFRPLAEQAVAELTAGRLVPLLHPAFALADAGAAHRAIAGRATMGKVILTP